MIRVGVTVLGAVSLGRMLGLGLSGRWGAHGGAMVGAGRGPGAGQGKEVESGVWLLEAVSV